MTTQEKRAKQVTLRLGEATISDLNYLCQIRKDSQAAMVRDLIAKATAEVLMKAIRANPELATGPQWFLNGGTLISLEEPQAPRPLRPSAVARKILSGFES